MKMRLLLCLIFCGTGIALAAGYLDSYRRITSRTVDGENIIYHWREGKRTGVITQQITRIVGRLPGVKYSKLKLITAAKAAGKWDTLKAAIRTMGMEDEWQACQYITSDYPAYIAATNAVVSQGIASEAEVKSFMEKAED